MTDDSETRKSTRGVPQVSRPVNYRADDVPNGYRCAKCGANGVKLWREYNTFANHRPTVWRLCGH